MRTKLLALKQLGRQLTPWSQAKTYFQPRNGWISCIRKALGMTSVQLAKRLGVARSRITKIQQAELANSLTLHTLKETANALNCDLVYALVPRKPLETLVREQAEKIARQKLQRVSHSMALEAQAVAKPQQQEQLEELINTLLSGTLKQLWDETHEI